jgi:hypothetical protein
VTNNAPTLWKAPSLLVNLDKVSDPSQIVTNALQLRSREQLQISSNFEAENYEIASAFVWMRTMALLKKQLSSLGLEFIAELLQRPDIDEYSEPNTAISDAEAISLANDLGIITKTQTLRLMQSQATISHFASSGVDLDDEVDVQMTREEAISCLRVCVQGVLGHEKVSVAEDFKIFREKLGSQTLSKDSPEVVKLRASPYFFVRTAISILLSLLKQEKGAHLEHAARNALVIIPEFWESLNGPERWQVGRAYSETFSEGKKESVKVLHSALLIVSGFDYVPENLRSTSFIKVANAVIAAHQGMNNFYNEPGPMNELANMGTSIPGPAIAVCVTAALCVKLGNGYGVSRAAQPAATKVLDSLSKERWIYYLNERLSTDRVILAKLSDSFSSKRWFELLERANIDAADVTNRDIKSLVRASREENAGSVARIAVKLLRESL